MGSSSHNKAPDQAEHSLTVTDNRTGKTYKIPIEKNSIKATDFSQIKATRHSVFGKVDREEYETENGLRIHDPAFSNTTVVESQITYINGSAGILRYRGYPIEQLAEKSNFLEAAYLLIYGELPTVQQYENWSDGVLHHSTVHRDVESLVAQFRYDSHPMSIMISGFAALGAFAPEANPSLQGQTIYTKGAKGDPASLALFDKQVQRILGKAPTLAALAYRIRQGRPFQTPPPGLSYAGTFFYLLDHLNEKEYRPNPVLEKCLDTFFLLHADHEMNLSTATCMTTGSGLADPYSCVSAACASLYGPLHGGANEAVIRMLTKLANQGGVKAVPEFLEKVKRKEEVLSGFGHRIYTVSDPRSFIVRKTADEVFKVTGKSQFLDIAIALHDQALKDDYFISRRLAPNVDFWSGLCYSQMGFPTDFMVVLFAIPRVAGWLGHLRQMWLNEKGVKIWRPRQIYVGAGERDYVPMSQRPEPGPEAPLGSQPTKVSQQGDTRRSKLATFVDETGKKHVGSRL